MKALATIVITASPGSVCGWFEQDDFYIGYMISLDHNFCNIIHPDGRHVSLPLRRIALSSLETYSSADPAEFISGFQDKVTAALNATNPEQIRRDNLNKAEVFSLEELLEAAHLPENDVSRFALYLSLRSHPACFRLKAGLYHLRPEADYASSHAAELQKQADAVFWLDVSTWLQSVLTVSERKASLTDVPPLPRAALQRLESEILGYQNGRFVEPLSRILRSLKPELPYPDWLLLIRTALGQIDKTTPPLIAAANLPHIFSPDVRKNGCGIASYMPEQSRIDLEPLDCFTVDAAGTFDMDDALSLQKTEDGWQLGIHISDVSWFVRPGSLVDKEAFRRTSSIYLPDADIHMLPDCLSCDKASLLSGVLRPALSVLCSVNAAFELVSCEAVLSTVKIRHRLTYDEFEQLLNLDKATDHEQSEIIKILANIADRHLQKRLANGAVIIPDSSQTPARRAIAECMVIYNNWLAAYAKINQLPFFYRCQEEPLQDVNVSGDDLPWSIPPSVISTTPLPHRAMGLQVYAQLSSPLRRYPDLINQRQIAAHLSGKPVPYSVDELTAMLPHLLQTRQTIRRVTLQAEQQAAWGIIRESFLLHELKACVVRQAKGRTILFLPEFDCRISTSLPGRCKAGTELLVTITALNEETGAAAVLSNP